MTNIVSGLGVANATLSDITYYVRTDGDDSNTGLANTSAGAFKTIQKAIDSVPRVINHIVNIIIADGTYAEDLKINGLEIGGMSNGNFASFTLTGNEANATLVKVNSIYIHSCFGALGIVGLTATTTTTDGIIINRCVGFRLNFCQVLAAASFTGVTVYFSTGVISGGIYSNRSVGVNISTSSQVTIGYVSGTGNVIGVGSNDGSFTTKTESTITGTTPEAIVNGTLTSGVLNPEKDKTTADITYYVRTDGSDSNTGLYDTAGGAFKTIQKAINMIPKIINNTVFVYVADGTYAEDLSVRGFKCGAGGGLQITGNEASPQSVKINSMEQHSNFGLVTVVGFAATTTTVTAFTINRCVGFRLNSCQAIVATSANYGVIVYFSVGGIANCVFSNKNIGIVVDISSQVDIVYTGGTGNTVGISSQNGALLTKFANTITGTTPESIAGGTITSGVLNPWGDNTSSLRASGELSRSLATATQSIAAYTVTKILFLNTYANQKGICDLPNSKFIIPEDGVYLVSLRVGIDFAASAYNNRLLGYIAINGGINAQTGDGTILAGIAGGTVSCTYQIGIAKGNTVEFYVNSSAAATISNNDNYTHASIIRVA
jgi:hypothetical protein